MSSLVGFWLVSVWAMNDLEQLTGGVLFIYLVVVEVHSGLSFERGVIGFIMNLLNRVKLYCLLKGSAIFTPMTIKLNKAHMVINIESVGVTPPGGVLFFSDIEGWEVPFSSALR